MRAIGRRRAGEARHKRLISGVMLLAGLLGMNLAAHGANTLTIRPSSLAFGTVAVGRNSALSVTITNNYRRTVQIQGIQVTGTAFSYAGLTLPATVLLGQSATISVTFTPTAIQGYTGRLTFLVSDGSKPTVTVSGSGVAPAAVAPQITFQPAGQTVTAGQTASFQASATGTAPMSYQWMKNGGAISGATSAAYTTPATTTADNGAQFSVTVSNAAGSASSSSASLTVNTPITAPLITSQPANQTITAGQTASFSVSATGTAPLSYQWMKNGGAIGGASSSSYTTPASTTADSGAQFTVAVSNTAGSASSSAAILSVTAASSCLTSSPIAWTNTAVASQTTPFTASYDATPGQANMDGVVGFSLGAATQYTSLAAVTRFSTTGVIDVMNGTGYAADVAVAYVTGATYHFRVVIDPTSYTYSVYVTPAGGTEVLLAKGYAFRAQQATTATLNNWGMLADVGSQTVCNMSVLAAPVVPAAPLITSQPAGATIVAGQSVSFTTSVTGTAPLSYQWNRNGGAIAGATSPTYTLAAPTTADSGAQFSVTVSNTAGRVTSSSALLTVSAASASLTANPTSLSFGTVALGSNSTLSATITNSGNSNITLSNVSISGAGFNASGLSSGQAIAAGQSATLNVTLAPSSTGSAAGSLSIASNAANSPVTVALTGTGGPAPAQHSVSLSWSPSSSSVAGYNVYSGSVSGGPYYKVTSNPVTGTSYTDASVHSGGTYYYTVTSVNAANVESSYSNEVIAVVP